MSLIDRVKNILLTPKTEWPVIAAETATTSGLFTGYAALLAVLPAIGSILGVLVIGGMFASALGAAGGALMGAGLGFTIINAIVGILITLGIVYLMSIIAAALAPSFDGQKDQTQALKLVVYSATAIWVAGLLAFIPVLGWLLLIAGYGYAAYLMYLGAPILLKVPEQKVIGFAVVTILIWIVVTWVIALILGAVVFGGMMAATAGIR
jgi:hypothetical protein